ncbi:hypothetical protein IT575_13670 [bacterium]|nr:hypothetical protein [bacterium]
MPGRWPPGLKAAICWAGSSSARSTLKTASGGCRQPAAASSTASPPA